MPAACFPVRRLLSFAVAFPSADAARAAEMPGCMVWPCFRLDSAGVWHVWAAAMVSLKAAGLAPGEVSLGLVALMWNEQLGSPSFSSSARTSSSCAAALSWALGTCACRTALPSFSARFVSFWCFTTRQQRASNLPPSFAVGRSLFFKRLERG
jgi:hypothetical protein